MILECEPATQQAREARETMGKKKMGRPKSARDDVAVKIDRAIKGRAQIVAKSLGLDLAEYLSRLLDAPVARDFRREMKKMDVKSGHPTEGE